MIILLARRILLQCSVFFAKIQITVVYVFIIIWESEAFTFKNKYTEGFLLASFTINFLLNRILGRRNDIVNLRGFTWLRIRNSAPTH